MSSALTRNVWVAVLASLLCCAVAREVQAAPEPLIIERYVPDGDRGARFELMEGHPPVDRSQSGVWLRVLPQAAWPQQPAVFTIGRLLYGEVSAVQGDAAASEVPPPLSRPRVPLMQKRVRVFLLPEHLSAQTPLWVYLAQSPKHARVPALAAEPLSDFSERYAIWMAVVSACMAIMLAMACMALVFTVLLKDAAYLLYAVYLLCFLTIQQFESDYGFAVLSWPRDAAWLPAAGQIATIGGVIFACLFLMQFSRLREYSLGAWRILVGYIGLFTTIMGAGLLPLESTQAVAHVLLNPMLALGALLVPACALWSWTHGSRYGAYFLMGWLPLMAVTFWYSLPGVTQDLPYAWSAQYMLIAGAFESLALSVGLADRALAHRHRFLQTHALTLIDPLTGLLNRRGWLEGIQPMIAGNRDAGASWVLWFIDLDHFKLLNDTFGHPAGDEALKRVAGLLLERAPPGSVVGRYGGEEFVVAMPLRSAKRSLDIAERTRRDLAEMKLPVDRGATFLTMSAGLALAQVGEPLETLLKRADEAMYQAKSQGRNKVLLGTAVVQPQPRAMRPTPSS